MNQNLPKGRKPYGWKDTMPTIEPYLDGPPPKSSRVVRAPTRRPSTKAGG